LASFDSTKRKAASVDGGDDRAAPDGFLPQRRLVGRVYRELLLADIQARRRSQPNHHHH
jgi:hypothetical protein